MTSELASRSRGPATVLEVGAGTGRITEEIVRHLSDGDRLDVYEIDCRMAEVLRKRIDVDDCFRGSGANVRVFQAPVEEIDPDDRYDFVISCLPFTNFRPEKVRHIFELYRAVLAPGGTCSFYEYVLVRRAAGIITGTASKRRRFRDVSRVVRDYVDRYGFAHDLVLMNLPPAAVHHIRFSNAPL